MIVVRYGILSVLQPVFHIKEGLVSVGVHEEVSET